MVYNIALTKCDNCPKPTVNSFHFVPIYSLLSLAILLEVCVRMNTCTLVVVTVVCKYRNLHCVGGTRW